MASPVLKPRRERFIDQRSSNESAALRLIAAERPEEIFPILLEEIVFLGFPRAAVLELDFDTGEVMADLALRGLTGWSEDLILDVLVARLARLAPRSRAGAGAGAGAGASSRATPRTRSAHR